MSYASQMLESDIASRIDPSQLAETIDALGDCAQACTADADADLREDSVASMVTCIRLCLDCSDVVFYPAASHQYRSGPFRELRWTCGSRTRDFGAYLPLVHGYRLVFPVCGNMRSLRNCLDQHWRFRRIRGKALRTIEGSPAVLSRPDTQSGSDKAGAQANRAGQRNTNRKILVANFNWKKRRANLAPRAG